MAKIDAVQDYINQGLLVIDEEGKPLVNAEAVLQSERES